MGLTIPLHAPDDELRRRLIPTAAGTSIDDLVAAARDYIARRGRRVTFAYALLDGVNDSVAQARELIETVKGVPCKINLIPFNPFEGSGYARSKPDAVRRFQEILLRAGLVATTRKTRGDDIAAACGQLAARGERTAPGRGLLATLPG